MTEPVERRWVVDSIEEGIARVEEDGVRMLTVPKGVLPSAVTEGQVLRVRRAPGAAPDSWDVVIEVDHEATTASLEKSKATMSQAMEASKKRDPGGDVAL